MAQTPLPGSMEFTRVPKNNPPTLGIGGNNLSMTQSDFGGMNNVKKFAMFIEYSRTQYGIHDPFIIIGTASGLRPDYALAFEINPSDHMAMTIFQGASGQIKAGAIESGSTYRNQNAHKVLFCIDVDEPIDSNRLRITVDGVNIIPAGWKKWPQKGVALHIPDAPVWIGGYGIPGNRDGSGPDNTFFAGWMKNVMIFRGGCPAWSDIIDQYGNVRNAASILSLPNLVSFLPGNQSPLEDDLKLTPNWKNQAFGTPTGVTQVP